ncbi:MAG: hypothetical protein CMJ72_05430 [Planctomycetaceae bacterium]|nr:hypothetical protein [Planctomycetaceae bacterium]HCK41882.1 hypothetical protein [Planctomycetaceae bacterium]
MRVLNNVCQRQEMLPTKVLRTQVEFVGIVAFFLMRMPHFLERGPQLRGKEVGPGLRQKQRQ